MVYLVPAITFYAGTSNRALHSCNGTYMSDVYISFLRHYPRHFPEGNLVLIIINTKYMFTCMFTYVGHIVSATEKSDLDQVLSRKRPI